MFGKALSCMPEMRYKVFALTISGAFCFLNCRVSDESTLQYKKENWNHGIEQMQPCVPFSSSF